MGATYVDYNGKTSLELKVKLPPDARPGQQSLVVKAQTADGTFDLPLTLTVQPEVEEALTAEPKLPTLQRHEHRIGAVILCGDTEIEGRTRRTACHPFR